MAAPEQLRFEAERYFSGCLSPPEGVLVVQQRAAINSLHKNNHSTTARAYTKTTTESPGKSLHENGHSTTARAYTKTTTVSQQELTQK